MRRLLVLTVLGGTLAFAFLPSPAEAALVVGVTDQHLDPDHNIVENCFVEALAAAGHVPVVVPCLTNDAALAEIVAKLDALVFTGGADVEPARYQTPRAPKCCDPDLLRDDFEFRLLAAARARRLPIVGICRGCQLVNVGFGGTLWQDLPAQRPGSLCHDQSPAPRGEASHPVSPVPGSRLAALLGTEPFAVTKGRALPSASAAAFFGCSREESVVASNPSVLSGMKRTRTVWNSSCRSCVIEQFSIYIRSILSLST